MRLNEKLIDLLEELSEIMMKKGQPMRARAYTKAKETIYNINEDITDIKQLKGQPFIGDTILEKFDTYLKEGKLELIENFKLQPENILSDIYGVGPKKAKELVEKGIKSVDSLREKQDDFLNDKQKIGLKYYEDILKRIPRDEIEEYNKIFTEINNEIGNNETKFEIVGSYRRGATSSGDIDVIITNDNDNIKLFNDFLDKLIEKNIIIEILSRGQHKSLVIARNKENSIARRVDFLFTTRKEYPFAVLYFTGSKAFNTVMRGYALKNGLSLNEHGISKKIKGVKEEKLDLDFKEEKDIFDYLGLEYKKPTERINGTAVVIKKNENIQETLEKNVTLKKFSQEPKKNLTKRKKQKKEQVSNSNLYDRFIKMKEQQLRDELSLLSLKKGIEEPKKIETKQEVIEKIIELKEDVEKKETPKNTSIKEIKETPKNITKRKNLKEKGEKGIMKVKKMKKQEIIKMMNTFKEKGINYLETLKKEELEFIIKLANKQFHSYDEKKSEVTLNDNEYDIIKDLLEKKHPDSEVLNEVGAEFDKNKVDLPVNMPSMNKIKPTTNAVTEWKNKYKGDYVLSCKLDGVSGLYYSVDDVRKMYTRGNGKVGQDVSHLMKYVNGIPNKSGVIVRGEFIISKNTFDTKYKDDFSNARNMVAGLVNKKKVDMKTKDIDFISYEMIEPKVKPSEQMKLMEEYGFKVVKNSTVKEIDNDKLSDVLLDYRNNYEYIIDGVIVSDDNIHNRTEKNPEHSFAFKMVLSDQVVESKVLDVIWTASKSGYLKPRVKIEPVNIGGVNIEYATGFNGNFVESNKIGIGAVIQIVRSGDVIPHIKSVTTPADKAKMPDVPYVWTTSHVDIILENKEDDMSVKVKNISSFFTTLEVESLSEGNVSRIIKAGYDTIPKILKMKMEDFSTVEGFKEKLSTKILNSIKEKIEKADIVKIAAASNKLGRGIGEKKIKPILEKYPDFFTNNIGEEERKTKLKEVNGIGKENAESIVKNMPELLEFIRQCDLNNKLEYEKEPEKPISEEIKSHPLYNKKIVMTKVRDKEITEKLKLYKADLVDNVKIDVFSVITKSKEDKSNKLEKARELNIEIFTPEEFKQKYLV